MHKDPLSKLPAADTAKLAPEKAQQLQAMEATFTAAFHGFQESFKELGKLKQQYTDLAHAGAGEGPPGGAVHEDPREESVRATKSRRGEDGAPLVGAAAAADKGARAAGVPAGDDDDHPEAMPSDKAVSQKELDKAVAESVKQAKDAATHRLAEREKKSAEGTKSCS